MAILKQIKFGSSTTPIAQTIVTAASDSVLSVNGTHTDLADDKDPSYEVDLRIDGTTLVKSSDDKKVLKVGTVPAAQVSVVDEGGKLTATNVEAALAELDDKITSTGNVAKKYKVVSVDSPAGTSLAEYKLQVAEGTSETYADVTGSANIVVPKDQHLKDVVLVNQRPAKEGESGPVSGNFLKFTYVLNNGTESDVYVDVSAFLSESEFGDGLEVSNAGVVSVKLGQGLKFGDEAKNKSINVKIDSTSEKDSQSTPVDFLTVGANGVKIQGIGAEIDRKIAALDVTDAAKAGQYVSKVSETDGKIDVERANVSDAVLNGYAKGEKPTSTAINDTDDVKGALAKLEHQVDAAKAAATTKVVEGTDDGNNMEIVSAQSDADGSTTYTINLTDVASKAALDAEIAARKAVDGQDGQTYAANGGTTYISGATSLNDADVKLDAAIKAEETRANSAETSIDVAIGLTKGVDNETRTFTPTTNYGADSTSVVNNMQKLDTKLKEVADGLAAVQYKVSGTTLEFYGMTEHA